MPRRCACVGTCTWVGESVRSGDACHSVLWSGRMHYFIIYSYNFGTSHALHADSTSPSGRKFAMPDYLEKSWRIDYREIGMSFLKTGQQRS